VRRSCRRRWAPGRGDRGLAPDHWCTTDDGTTWHAATSKLSGGKWAISVHNPASGRVGLRSTVTDIHGDSSTTTVYNAYAVS
jgi:hypothetical protein